MADDAIPNAEEKTNAAANVVQNPEAKKRRGGRPPKVATDMMGGMSVAKAPRATRKRAKATDAPSSRSTDVEGAKGTTKPGGRTTRAKPATAAEPAPLTAIDEMADLIQLEQENQRLRKALSEKLRAANNKNPLADLKPAQGEDPAKAKPQDFASRSDFMSFNGSATIVPKRAILHTPAAMSARIKLQPGSKIQTWADFYASNRGWITTVEVTRAQAEGKVPLAEDLIKRIEKSTSVVVATYQSGPISVLAPKAPEPAPAPQAPATVQPANSKKP